MNCREKDFGEHSVEPRKRRRKRNCTTDFADFARHGFRGLGEGEIGRIMAGQNHILVGKKSGEREGPLPADNQADARRWEEEKL